MAKPEKIFQSFRELRDYYKLKYEPPKGKIRAYNLGRQAAKEAIDSVGEKEGE